MQTHKTIFSTISHTRYLPISMLCSGMLYTHAEYSLLLSSYISCRCDGFLGEGLNNKKVLAVKTHMPNGYFDAVIFLVRNPYRAMVSYQAFELTGGHKRSAKCKEIDSLIVASKLEEFTVCIPIVWTARLSFSFDDAAMQS